MPWKKAGGGSIPSANRTTLDKLGEKDGSLIFNGTPVGTKPANGGTLDKFGEYGDSLTFGGKAVDLSHENRSTLDKVGESNGSLTFNGIAVENTTVNPSATNGKVMVNGADILVYDDSTVKQSIAGKSTVAKSDTNGNVILNGVETQVYNDSTVKSSISGKSTVTSSTVNGNIKVDGVELKAYDDATVQSSLAGKSNVGHSHTLSNVTDVDAANKTDGFALIYDATAQKFKSKALPTGVTGGVTQISQLTDVDVATIAPADGNALTFSGGKWKPGSGGYKYQANAMQPLYVKGMKPEYKNQVIHPKVMYFPSRFGGYKFWMAYTPYPNGVDGYENPHIACSNDGINWGMPTGGENLNPMDAPPPDQEFHSYFSDTHLTFRDDTNTLELWYREAWNGSSTQAGAPTAYERIWRRTTTDGKTWTAPEQMYQRDGGVAFLLAPALIWDNVAQLYRIWAVYNSSDLRYYESPDGHNWQFIRSTGITGWHADVTYTPGVGYEVLMYVMGNVPNNKITWSVSTDLITYSAPKDVIFGRGAGHWDATLYRPSLVKVDKKYYVYYTGVNGGSGSLESPGSSAWNLGLSVAQKDDDVGLTSLLGWDPGENSYFQDFPAVNPVITLTGSNKWFNVLPQLSGTTTERRRLSLNPTDGNLYKGLCWFDTTLNKPFWLSQTFGGMQWRDANGTVDTWTNQAPTISQNIANVTLGLGRTVGVRFTATDDTNIGFPTNSFSVDGGVTFTNYNPITIDINTGLYSWMVPNNLAAGTYQCQLGVKDGSQVWAYSNIFTLTIS